MGELIERQAAIDALEFEKVYMSAFKDGVNEGNLFERYNSGLDDGIKALNKVPAAQPELPIKQKCTVCPHCDNCDVNDDGTTTKREIIHCKDCVHNNDCEIQYSAQAGDNFFCGFGETEKDVREDVYE